VKRERSLIVRRDEGKTKEAPRRPRRPRRPQIFRVEPKAPTSPYSLSRGAVRSSLSKTEGNSSLVSTAKASSSSSLEHDHLHPRGSGTTTAAKTTPRSSIGEGGNPALEGEAHRLDALKRRRYMELQQTLAYELRSLAREVSKRGCVPLEDAVQERANPRVLCASAH